MTMFYKILQQNWDYIQPEGLIIFLKFTLRGSSLYIHVLSHITHMDLFLFFQEKYLCSEASIHSA